MENPPAEVKNQSTGATDRAGDITDTAGKSDKKEPLSLAGVLEGFNNLNVLRQIGLLLGFAASIALGFAVVLWSQEESYRPLLGSLANMDAQAVVEILESNQIPYKIDTASGALLVPTEQIHQARIKLAGSDLSTNNTVGFELLDQEQSLGTSQFMETARYRRSLEGELARTIASLQPVRSARVHLAIPKRSVFVRDSRKPTASVFLDLYAGRSLSREQAHAIMNLVAASIPELDPRQVTIVDQRGRLLSEQHIDESDKLVAKQFEYTRKLEQVLTQRVRSILEPVVGADHFQAAVSVEVDFTQVEQTEEQYNPDLPALRSEQTLDEQRIGEPNQGGIPGALSNQPPGQVSVPEQVIDPETGEPVAVPPTNTRKQATRNYELDRTLSYIRNQPGRIERLTVAVVVDDMVLRNPETGAVSRKPWNEQELQRLTILVRDAVGFNAARGDSVNVVNTPFADVSTVDAGSEIAIWQEPWFWDLAKQVLAGLFILLLIFGVLRPLLRNLVGAGKESKALELSEGEELTPIEDDIAEDKVTLSAIDEPLLAGPNESFERQLSAIRSMVAEDPGRVAQVVRQWVVSDE